MQWRLPFLLLILFPGMLSGQGPKTYHFDLQPRYGQQAINAKGNDLNASATVIDRGDSLTVVVLVKDDDLQFDPPLIRSDHVELWLGTAPMQTRYYAVDYGLFDIRDDSINRAGIPNFTSEYNDRKSWESGDEEDTVQVSDVRIGYALDGLVHWGIGESAERFDEEFYRSGLTLPSSGLQAPAFEPRKTIGKNPVRYTFHISKELLLFAHSREVKELYLNIEVFDRDADAQTVTVYSMNKEFEWGTTEHLTRIPLSQPWLLDIPEAEARFLDAFEDNGDFLVRTSSGWELVTKGFSSVGWWDVVYDMEINPYEVWFDEREFAGRQFEIIGFLTSGHIISPPFRAHLGGLTQARTDTTYSGTEPYFTSWEFPDGSIGILLEEWYYRNPWQTGPCGSCEHQDVQVFRLTKDRYTSIFEVTLIEANYETFYRTAPPEFEKMERAVLESVTWNPEKQVLELDVYKDVYESDIETERYEVGWDAEWKPIIRSGPKK